MLLPDIARASAEAYPNLVAARLGGAQLNYQELFRRSCRLANGLRQVGVRTGDRVAFLCDNRLESVEHIVGTALAGAVRASLYSYYSAGTNAYLIDHIAARVLVIDRLHLRELASYLQTRPDVRVVVIGDDAAELLARESVGYEDLLAAASPADPAVSVGPDDPYQIRFSSGTSGRPKGIWHSFERWGAVDAQFRESTPPMRPGDAYLCPGSLAHIAIGMFWSAIGAGAAVLPLERFDAGETLRLIEQFRITHAAVVPAMIAALVDHPDLGKRDVSSVRCLLYAGSPIAPKTLERALTAFGPALFQFFGQSEVVPVTMLTGDDHANSAAANHAPRLRSAGRPIGDVAVSIVNADGSPTAPGEIGEVVVTSPGSMSGLWGDSQGTAQRTSADGGVYTRDMGYVDDDGYLFIVDRKDDMIISGGFNIWPAELESALLEHPGVADAAVVGVPHDRWGETPKAFIVVKPGGGLDPDELMAFVAARVGRIKRPTSIEFLDVLPRSDNGKVQRKQLRAPYWTDASARIAGS